MKLLDLSLSTAQKNLALEEALLEHCETTATECIRFWESSGHFVVLGAGSPYKTDVNHPECERRGIPVLRRCSGGGTVIQGPGCLNYTFVLDRETRSGLDSIASTNEVVLGSIAKAMAICGTQGAQIKGYSDLTTGPLKFSGNAQRRRKRFVLFHGTILHSFDLDLISACLDTPEKMPDYREGREHRAFVTNIPVDARQLRNEIATLWDAQEPLMDWPAARTAELAVGRYADQAWITSI